ncbi:hypothetical protein BJ165DRAFT_660689 [Panaeolus papilionaceus]|nr:hypothetical protein BJ165DRAFT_660689 [Panaeolus papilionaceus]
MFKFRFTLQYYEYLCSHNPHAHQQGSTQKQKSSLYSFRSQMSIKQRQIEIKTEERMNMKSERDQNTPIQLVIKFNRPTSSMIQPQHSPLLLLSYRPLPLPFQHHAPPIQTSLKRPNTFPTLHHYTAVCSFQTLIHRHGETRISSCHPSQARRMQGKEEKKLETNIVTSNPWWTGT